MKNIWKKVLLLCAISTLIIGFLLFKIVKNNDDSTKESLRIISDTSSYSDIILFLENAKKEDSILFEIPQKDTVQDYNTYYGNEILLLIGGKNCEDIEAYVNESACSENFMDYKHGDIFESVEKIYYLQKLADDISGNYYNSEILKIVSSLIENSYDESGFFYYDEFDYYLTDMTEEEVITTRIYHTMMTLYLCSEYGLIDRLDGEAISKYILDSIAENDDVTNLYYAYLCYEYLDKDIDFLDEEKIVYDNSRLDIIELNAYVSLAKEIGKPIGQKDIIAARMKAYVDECRVSNMMELFVAIDVLDKIDESIDTAEKEKIRSLLHMYQNNDSTFPCITYYILDNKQILMYYQMTKIMGIESDITEYEKLLLDDFGEQDYYDLYAYAYFASRLDISTVNIERKVISELSQCTLDNKSSIGYLLLALSELGVDIKKSNEKNNYIDGNVINYINLITSIETIEYDIQDLILLYGFLKSGIIEINDIIVSAVDNIEVEQVESMQALVAYYKYEILAFAEQELENDERNKIFDRTKMEEILSKLRCEGGFKMNEYDQFIDLQASYYLINLLGL